MTSNTATPNQVLSSFAAITLIFTLHLDITPSIDIALPLPSNFPTFYLPEGSLI
jgi:hypothetical protein